WATNSLSGYDYIPKQDLTDRWQCGVAVEELDLELVEMEPAKPTVELHGLRGQAAKSTQMLDDRAESGHRPNGIVVKLDGTREVGQPRFYRDLRGVNRKGESRTDRVVGFLLERIQMKLSRGPKLTKLSRGPKFNLAFSPAFRGGRFLSPV